MTQEAYYDRTMNELIESSIKQNGPFRWLVDFVLTHEDLDFQTGNSWFSIYRGTSRIFAIKGKKGLKFFADPAYMDLVPELFVRPTKELLEKLLQIVRTNPKFSSYYNDGKHLKEGLYQTAISRRYTLDCKQEDAFIIIDKEFELGYKDTTTRNLWKNPLKEHYKEMFKLIEGKKGFPSQIKCPGVECDFLALTKTGYLVLLELKRYEDGQKVYLSPFQVGMYDDLTKKYVAKYGTNFQHDILTMLHQKIKLGLINPKWETPNQIKVEDGFKLAVIVGFPDEKTKLSNQIIENYKLVKDIVNKPIDLLWCDKKGIIIRDRIISKDDEETSFYKDKQIDIQSHWIPQGKGKGKFLYPNYNTLNLYDETCAQKVCQFFKENSIKWWSCSLDKNNGTDITRHILSSQVACINHLFPLRYNEPAILKILNALNIQHNNASVHFKALKLIDDRGEKGYISFECVSKKDYLNEIIHRGAPKRGEYCTSIDALINAIDDNNQTWLIPIEWKYTESYKDDIKYNKSREDRDWEPYLSNNKGKKRIESYKNLINDSKQLIALNQYIDSIYFREPFYQLMRQTLWAEQINIHKAEPLSSDHFVHVHVVPKDNDDLLKYNYSTVTKQSGLEAAWREMIKDQSKYIIIDPKDLLNPIQEDANYTELISYLQTRYWN